MDPRGLLLLFSFFIYNICGAVLPKTENDFDIHFKHRGIHASVKLVNRSAPLKGGEINAELPVQGIFKLIKEQPMLFAEVVDSFKDILTLKTVISYNGENLKSGDFDVKISYTFVHTDHTEESGTIHVWKQGKQIKMQTVLKTRGEKLTVNVDINIAEKKIFAVQKHNDIQVTHLEIDIQKEKTLQLIFPVKEKSLIFKKTNDMISAELIENDVLKFKLLMKSEIAVDNDTKFSATLKTSLDFPVNSDIHVIFCGLFSTACFRKLMVEIPFEISVVGDGSNAFRKYDYKVSVRKDNLELYKATIFYQNSPEEKDLKLTFPIQKNSFLFKQTRDMISAEIVENGVTNVRFVMKSETSVDDDTKFSSTLKTSLDFPVDSDIYEGFCELFPLACFRKLTIEIPFEIIVVGDGTKAVRKYDFKVSVNKDKLEIYHLEISNKQSPYILIFKSLYDLPFVKYFTWISVTKSPFQIMMEFNPNEKRFTVKSDMFTQDKLIQIMNPQDRNFILKLNYKVIAKFNVKETKVELIEILKNGKEAKHTLSWTGADLLENNATATLMYKDVPQVATIAWNVRDLTHGKVMIDIVGKKAPVLRDCEFHRNVNWNVISDNEFEINWTGRTATNIVQVLPTPILTDAKILFNNKDVRIEIQKKFNFKTYTLIFNTKPFKFALLPFFEI